MEIKHIKHYVLPIISISNELASCEKPIKSAATSAVTLLYSIDLRKPNFFAAGAEHSDPTIPPTANIATVNPHNRSIVDCDIGCPYLHAKV